MTGAFTNIFWKEEQWQNLGCITEQRRKMWCQRMVLVITDMTTDEASILLMTWS